MFVGGLSVVAIAAISAGLFMAFRSQEGNDKKVAQGPTHGPGQQKKIEDNKPKGERPSAPPASGKKTRTEEDDEPPAVPPAKTPPEQPPEKTPEKPRETAPEKHPDKSSEMPPKRGPEPAPDVPPVKDPPPARDPKPGQASKTRDGAMTAIIHPEKNLRFVDVSPDGTTLYTAAWDNRLRVWDAATLDLKDEFELPKPDRQPNSRLHAALSPDGKRLVFAHWDLLQIMDLASKKVEIFGGMPKEEHGLGQIILSGDGRVALSRWATVDYALWQVPERKFVTKLKYDGMGLARNNASVLGSDGGSWAHAPMNAYGVSLRSLPDCRDLGLLAGPETPDAGDATNYSGWAPALSPKGRLFAYVQSHKQERRIRVFDLVKRDLRHDMPLLKYSKNVLDPIADSLAISPDEKLLVVLDSDRWLHGYDLEKGKFLGAFAFPRLGAWSSGGDDERVVRFTRDGRRLVAGALNLVKVWDLESVAWPDPADPVNQPEPAKGPMR